MIDTIRFPDGTIDRDAQMLLDFARECNEGRMRIRELEDALRDVRQAIVDKAPDTLWVDMITTAVDRIDGVLQRK